MTKVEREWIDSITALRRSLTVFLQIFPRLLTLPPSVPRQIADVKIRALLLLTASTLAFVAPVRADGFIVIMADDNKLVQAKKALAFCLANLNADDRFEIVRFSTEPEQLFGKLTPASDTNVADAQKFVAKLKPEGGTAIFDAPR
jgi:hypothetical protein